MKRIVSVTKTYELDIIREYFADDEDIGRSIREYFIEGSGHDGIEVIKETVMDCEIIEQFYARMGLEHGIYSFLWPERKIIKKE